MSRRSMPLCCLAALMFLGLCGASGSDLNITSFGGNGELVFDEIPEAHSYRIEWASAAGGPWYSFEGSGLLNGIVAAGTGSVTSSVPMFYRVIAVTDNPQPHARNMVSVPGGFISGTNPLAAGETYSDDYPETYSLSVDTFYMDATEVTKAQWDVVYNWAVTNGYSFTYAGSGKAFNHPVHSVNWYDCVKWCNARSEKEGRTPCYKYKGMVYKASQLTPDCNYSANGYRLPSNVEWEYAARGGLSGKRFPWGDTITHSHANYYSSISDSYDVSSTRGMHPDYDDDGYTCTSPVGDFPANGYGLYDMAGNMWEWCDTASGSSRCLRGGNWGCFANYARCGHKYWYNPAYALDYGGFRTVCR